MIGKVFILHGTTLTSVCDRHAHQGQAQIKESRSGVMLIEQSGFKRWFSDEDPFFLDLVEKLCTAD